MIPEEITKNIQIDNPIHNDVIIDSSQSKRKIKYSEAAKFGDTTVQIIPTSLDFHYMAIGEEAHLDILFVNMDAHNEMVVFNVVSDYLNIEISPLNNNVVGAKQNMTIRINYIPTHVYGDFTMISIMTSIGTFQYEVKGKGFYSPHKMKTHVGRKIPVGVIYEESIVVYNPSNSLLQIEEIYLLNNFLNFTFPDTPGPSSWIIEPHTEKSIINFSFISSNPGKFAGNIVIKTNTDVVLVSVVQIFVVKDDVFALPEEIDFGVLTSSSQTTTALVSVLNGGSGPVKILDLYANSDSNQLSIQLAKIDIESFTENEVAKVTFSGLTSGLTKGKLTMLLKTPDGNPYNSRKEIDFKANVIPGFLEFQQSHTAFPISFSTDKIEKNLELTNRFEEAIYIIYVEIFDSHFVPTYTPSIVNPGETFNVDISLYPGDYGIFSTTLKVITNITIVDIPLFCYNGKLDVFVKDQDELYIDYGTISVDTTKYKLITITNNNPVSISVKDVVSDRIHVTLQYIHDSNDNIDIAPDPSGKLEFSLKPGDIAYLKSEITSDKAEKITGNILILSEFGSIAIPYTFQSIDGTLTYSPNTIEFLDLFPGKIFSETVYAFSSYSQPINITSIIPSDSRFHVKNRDSLLHSSQMTPIADISVDPLLFLDDSLLYYLSDSFLTNITLQNLDNTYSDYLKYWNTLPHGVSTILTVNTDIDSLYEVPARITLERPKLQIKTEFTFPKTQVQKSSGLYFPISNPSDSPIVLKALTYDFDSSPFFYPTEQMIIAPHTTFEFGPIIFSPQELADYDLKVLLWNNFSFVETLILIGHGGAPQLEIKGDFSELLPTNNRLFTSKEFSIINTGDMPLHSMGIYINDAFCTGYGFQILNCGIHFSLNPGESKNLTLVTIDTDTDHSIYRKLVVSTSEKDFEFPLNYDRTMLSQFTLQSLFLDGGMVALLCALFISFLKFDDFIPGYLSKYMVPTTDKNIPVKHVDVVVQEKKKPPKTKKPVSPNQKIKPVMNIDKIPPVVVHGIEKSEKVPKKVAKESDANPKDTDPVKTDPKYEPITSPTKSFIQQSVEKKYRKVDKPVDKKDKKEHRRLKRLSKPKLEELYTGPGLKLGNVNQTEEFKKFMDVRKEKDKSSSLPNFTNLPKVTPRKDSPNKKMSSTMVSLPNIHEMKRNNQSPGKKKFGDKKRSSKTPEKTRLVRTPEKRTSRTPEKRTSKRPEKLLSKTPEKQRPTKDIRKSSFKEKIPRVSQEIVEPVPEIIPTDVLFIGHQKKTQIVFEESSSDESSEINPPGLSRSVESVHRESDITQEKERQNFSMTYPAHPTPLLNYEDIKRKSNSPPPQLSMNFNDFSERPSRYQFENNRTTSPPPVTQVPPVYFNVQNSVGEPSPIKHTFGEQDPLAWKSGKSPRIAPTTGVIGDRQVSQQPGYSQFNSGSSLWERFPILGTEPDQEDNNQFRSFFSNDTLFSEAPNTGNESLFFEINQ